MAVWKALKYLMKETSSYKKANIQVDTTWLDSMNHLNYDDRAFVSGRIRVIRWMQI